MKTRRSCCWTCTARKIQCDGGLPTCKKCKRAQRVCQGYEARLSWPRDGDTKRATVGIVSPQVVTSPSEKPTNIFFINTRNADVRMHHNLSLTTQTHRSLSFYPTLMTQPQLRASPTDLIRHFYTSAYLSLVTFGDTHSQIRDALMSMASAQGTPSGLALFYALLAFASLHRYGLCEQAVELKITALHHLLTSMNEDSLAAICTSMLLAAFEILLPCESSEWLWYIAGAMDTVQTTSFHYDSNTRNLLEWLFYHCTLSRFAIHHWRHRPLSLNAPDGTIFEPRNLQSTSLTKYRPAPISTNPTFAILSLLSEVCDTLLDPEDPHSRDQQYHDSLRTLEGKVEDMSLQLASTKSNSDVPYVVELYQMATRIYLARASQSLGEPPANLDPLIDALFDGPVQSCTCEHFFPLFILACEARKEEQRVAILNLIDRTQRDSRIRSVEEVRNAILSVWVQQDLYEDSELLMNYVGIISKVISSSNTIPAFM